MYIVDGAAPESVVEQRNVGVQGQNPMKVVTQVDRVGKVFGLVAFICLS